MKRTNENEFFFFLSLKKIVHEQNFSLDLNFFCVFWSQVYGWLSIVIELNLTHMHSFYVNLFTFYKF